MNILKSYFLILYCIYSFDLTGQNITIPLSYDRMDTKDLKEISGTIYSKYRFIIPNDTIESESYFIKRFSFQFERELFEKTSSDGTEAYKDKVYKNLNINSNFFSKKISIAHYIDILVIKINNETIKLVVDTDRDFSFTNDSIYFLKGDFSKKYQKIEDLVQIVAPFEFDKGNGSILQEKLVFFINPYKSNFLYDNYFENRLPLSVIYSGTKIGRAIIESNEYIFRLNGNLNSPLFFSRYVELSFSSNYFNNSNEIKTYKIGDIIQLKDKQYLIESLSLDMDFLFLRRIKSLEIIKGNHKDEYIESEIFNPFFKDNNYLIINFWGTWCKPCLEEIDSLNSIFSKLNLKKIDFLSISTKSSIANINKLFDRENIKWKNIRDEDFGYLFSEKLRINTFPTTIVLSKQGKIVFLHEGVIDKKDILVFLKNINCLN